MLKLAISSNDRVELDTKRENFCKKTCPNHVNDNKPCTIKKCIFKEPISEKLYEELDRIKGECKIKKPKSTSGDKFWICSDVDYITEEEFIKAITHANRFDIKFAISNASLETWFIFHFNSTYCEVKNAEETVAHLDNIFKKLKTKEDPTNTYVKRKELKDANGQPYIEEQKTLEGLTQHFNKSNITIAKKTAKKRHQDEKNIPIPSNPGSTMYMFIEDIESLVGK